MSESSSSFYPGLLVTPTPSNLASFRNLPKYGMVLGIKKNPGYSDTIKILPLQTVRHRRRSRPAGSVVITAPSWHPNFWEPAPETDLKDVGLTPEQWDELSKRFPAVASRWRGLPEPPRNKGGRPKVDAPITGGLLQGLGFRPSTVTDGAFVRDMPDFEMLEREWATLVVQPGNGSDPSYWEVAYHRQNGNQFRPVDRLTLLNGVRRMGKIREILAALTPEPDSPVSSLPPPDAAIWKT